jgi:hypothetical protein
MHCGIKLLGYRVFYYYRLPYKRNLRRFKAMLKENSEKGIEGWLAYAAHANTYKMRQKIKSSLVLP